MGNVVARIHDRLAIVLGKCVTKHNQVEMLLSEKRLGFQNSARGMHIEIGPNHQLPRLQNHQIPAHKQDAFRTTHKPLRQKVVPRQFQFNKAFNIWTSTTGRRGGVSPDK